MAQHDINIEAGIIPVLDEKSTDALVKRLQRLLKHIKTAQHTAVAKEFQNLFGSVVASKIAAGHATTFTSARIATEQAIGIKGGSVARTFTREAADIVANKFAAQKHQTDIVARYEELQKQFLKFKENPSEEGRNDILKIANSIEKSVTSIDKSQKNLPYNLKQVTQSVSGIKKEVSDMDFGKNTTGESQNIKTVLSFFKKLTGLTTIFAGLKKGWESIQKSLTRGEQAMRLQAAYGKTIDWGDISARAGIFNISPESAAAPSQYASDFTQRMMWGEVSEREIIGLSRAGRWGKMVMSGEAAQNPEEANKAFEELVVGTDKAKMRSILRQIGIPQDVMNYNIQAYDAATRQEYEDRFKVMAATELDVAAMVYDAGNQLEASLKEVSTALAAFAGETFQYLSPQGREAYRRLRGNNELLGELQYTDRFARNRILSKQAERLGLNKGILGDQFWSSQFPDTRQITQNITNNTTITANSVDMDNIDEITNRMNASTSKAYYDEMAKSMPGMRMGF